MIVKRGNNIYDIRWNYDHSELYLNGHFVSSEDTETDAYKVIDEMEDAS
jgi:hypothetical protein